MGLPGLNQFYAKIYVSCLSTQHSDASEAQTRRPTVLSQALYHWATVLPHFMVISYNSFVKFHRKKKLEATTW